MKHQFYIIREDVLPYVVKRVLEVKASLKEDQSLTIQEAVDMHDCSRSAFYKYRDTIFPLEDVQQQTEVFTIILFVTDKVGILAQILEKLSELNLSVLTIHQSVPTDQKASITLSLDGRNAKWGPYQIINELRQMENVYNVDIIGMNM
ncbi:MULTISPECIES: ACT domain-containing protein [Staphylococcus intermedius group]|uniref:ACT domain-containing protein n=1 Tax=Staphylococcus intermedius NCTC 11048 TaxID=1141106 RepID=A0A380G5X8_STAIN|nr:MULTISPECIES: ACT domain-containing protein [Staphylococcus intermedius group]PCF64727.1 ACT domain-containing protein [Staphylococcus intermedius]PCF80337.1 ACT domain-containing protein [Staphylococcus intermedius]PCF81687.1 ACT domain-containing protein [Staphylococcus intermedius]PCF88024.1 ACT domain-containing protein [Staphylococcus intermedius]PCF88737.1 ACT domain-containing protein [Staphylococcus intermedius]